LWWTYVSIRVREVSEPAWRRQLRALPDHGFSCA
jgi:hypothetical protein